MKIYYWSVTCAFPDQFITQTENSTKSYVKAQAYLFTYQYRMGYV